MKSESGWSVPKPRF